MASGVDPTEQLSTTEKMLRESPFESLASRDRSFFLSFFFPLQASNCDFNWFQDKIKWSKGRTLKNGFFGETRGTITYAYLVGVRKEYHAGASLFYPKIWRPWAGMNAASEGRVECYDGELNECGVGLE